MECYFIFFDTLSIFQFNISVLLIIIILKKRAKYNKARVICFHNKDTEFSPLKKISDHELRLTETKNLETTKAMKRIGQKRSGYVYV